MWCAFFLHYADHRGGGEVRNITAVISIYQNTLRSETIGPLHHDLLTRGVDLSDLFPLS